MHLVLAGLVALSLITGVACLPVNPGTTERPQCLSIKPTNATRCIPNTAELFCMDATTEECLCPVGYFCHFDDVGLCYFSCQLLPEPTGSHEYNMNMLRGSESPGHFTTDGQTGDGNQEVGTQ